MKFYLLLLSPFWYNARECMQKGLNSDIVIRGERYHVQTEDWGEENPYIVTRVFCSGAVVSTVKTPYREILRTGPSSIPQAVRIAILEQHHRVLESLQNKLNYT
ncbi:MAG: hypothetical protein N2578_04200 [Bdellovibrionaceae bacterium]|nr:hypothetical protein [Pseudobdellovibrionaceae bacterium]